MDRFLGEDVPLTRKEVAEPDHALTFEPAKHLARRLARGRPARLLEAGELIRVGTRA